MKRYTIAGCLLWLGCLMCSPFSEACSTFYLPGADGAVFGKNYDWSVDDGLVIVNQRDVAKTAASGQPALEWISKYGSITFNQYGREFAHGGMNEVGLVIELMWLEATQYPQPDARFEMGSLQWVQYQLDTAATVAEVLASAAQIRITPDSAPLHYLTCDRTGACAAIEFLDGRLVAHTGADLPAAALTNSTYQQSIELLLQCEGFGGQQPIGRSRSSLDRFARAASRITQLPESDPMTAAFDILADVAQGEWTKWSIVYDLAGGAIAFRTYANPALRSVNFADFDFDCGAPVKVLDINAAGSGNVSGRFEDYAYQANRTLIGNAYRKTDFLRDVSPAVLDGVAAYPEDATECRKE